MKLAGGGRLGAPSSCSEYVIMVKTRSPSTYRTIWNFNLEVSGGRAEEAFESFIILQWDKAVRYICDSKIKIKSLI